MSAVIRRAPAHTQLAEPVEPKGVHPAPCGGGGGASRYCEVTKAGNHGNAGGGEECFRPAFWDLKEAGMAGVAPPPPF